MSPRNIFLALSLLAFGTAIAFAQNTGPNGLGNPTVTANQGTSPWVGNTTQLGGVAINLGTGTTGTGTQRIVTASDSPEITAIGSPSDAAYTGTGNCTLISCLKGNYNGVTGNVPNPNTPGGWGIGATGSTVPANGVFETARAQNAEATAVTNGQQVGLAAGLEGKLINLPYANKENFLQCAQAITVNTATTCTGMGAQGAGVKIYITSLCITRNDAGTTAVSATLNDGATTIYDIPNNGGGGGICPPLPVPLVVAANTAFQVTMSSGITTVHVSAQGYKGS